MEKQGVPESDPLNLTLDDDDFFVSRGTNNENIRKRSSILKQSKYFNMEVFESEDIDNKRKSHLKRVSFADTFQVKELQTGHVYDIPGPELEISKENSHQGQAITIEKENIDVDYAAGSSTMEMPRAGLFGQQPEAASRTNTVQVTYASVTKVRTSTVQSRGGGKKMDEVGSTDKLSQPDEGEQCDASTFLDKSCFAEDLGLESDSSIDRICRNSDYSFLREDSKFLAKSPYAGSTPNVSILNRLQEEEFTELDAGVSSSETEASNEAGGPEAEKECEIQISEAGRKSEGDVSAPVDLVDTIREEVDMSVVTNATFTVSPDEGDSECMDETLRDGDNDDAAEAEMSCSFLVPDGESTASNQQQSRREGLLDNERCDDTMEMTCTIPVQNDQIVAAALDSGDLKSDGGFKRRLSSGLDDSIDWTQEKIGRKSQDKTRYYEDMEITCAVPIANKAQDNEQSVPLFSGDSASTIYDKKDKSFSHEDACKNPGNHSASQHLQMHTSFAKEGNKIAGQKSVDMTNLDAWNMEFTCSVPNSQESQKIKAPTSKLRQKPSGNTSGLRFPSDRSRTLEEFNKDIALDDKNNSLNVSARIPKICSPEKSSSRANKTKYSLDNMEMTCAVPVHVENSDKIKGPSSNVPLDDCASTDSLELTQSILKTTFDSHSKYISVYDSHSLNNQDEVAEDMEMTCVVPSPANTSCKIAPDARSDDVDFLLPTASKLKSNSCMDDSFKKVCPESKFNNSVFLDGLISEKPVTTGQAHFGKKNQILAALESSNIEMEIPEADQVSTTEISNASTRPENFPTHTEKTAEKEPVSDSPVKDRPATVFPNTPGVLFNLRNLKKQKKNDLADPDEIRLFRKRALTPSPEAELPEISDSEYKLSHCSASKRPFTVESSANPLIESKLQKTDSVPATAASDVALKDPMIDSFNPLDDAVAKKELSIVHDGRQQHIPEVVKNQENQRYASNKHNTSSFQLLSDEILEDSYLAKSYLFSKSAVDNPVFAPKCPSEAESHSIKNMDNEVGKEFSLQSSFSGACKDNSIDLSIQKSCKSAFSKPCPPEKKAISDQKLDSQNASSTVDADVIILKSTNSQNEPDIRKSSAYKHRYSFNKSAVEETPVVDNVSVFSRETQPLLPISDNGESKQEKKQVDKEHETTANDGNDVHSSSSMQKVTRTTQKQMSNETFTRVTVSESETVLNEDICRKDSEKALGSPVSETFIKETIERQISSTPGLEKVVQTRRIESLRLPTHDDLVKVIGRKSTVFAPQMDKSSAQGHDSMDSSGEEILHSIADFELQTSAASSIHMMLEARFKLHKGRKSTVAPEILAGNSGKMSIPKIQSTTRISICPDIHKETQNPEAQMKCLASSDPMPLDSVPEQSSAQEPSSPVVTEPVAKEKEQGNSEAQNKSLKISSIAQEPSSSVVSEPVAKEKEHNSEAQNKSLKNSSVFLNPLPIETITEQCSAKKPLSSVMVSEPVIKGKECTSDAVSPLYGITTINESKYFEEELSAPCKVLSSTTIGIGLSPVRMEFEELSTPERIFEETFNIPRKKLFPIPPGDPEVDRMEVASKDPPDAAAPVLSAPVAPPVEELEAPVLSAPVAPPVEVAESDCVNSARVETGLDVSEEMETDVPEIEKNTETPAIEKEVSFKASSQQAAADICMVDSETTFKKPCDNALDPKPISLALMKKKLAEISEGMKTKWKLMNITEEKASMSLKWGFWLYECTLLMHISNEGLGKTSISFDMDEDEEEDEEAEEDWPLRLGYKLFAAMVSQRKAHLPFCVCSERTIEEIKEVNEIVVRAEMLMKDVFHISIMEEYKLSESMDPFEISVEVLNRNGAVSSIFLVLFRVNLRTYPFEKILPEITHMHNTDRTSEIKCALEKMEPGPGYLHNMVEMAKKI